MKDLSHCPACQTELYRGKDDLSSYSLCRCSFDYILRYQKDNKTPNYVSFKFTKFFATIYFNAEPPYPSNTIHVYSQEEMTIKGIAYPIVDTISFDPDFSNLKLLEDKIKILITFS